MKKTKMVVILLTVIIIVVLAMIILPGKGNKTESQQEAEAIRKEIVVALSDIPAYTTIDETMLETKEYPEELIPVDAYDEATEVVGATTLVDIAPGEVLVGHHVVSEEDTPKKLSMEVEPGMRAMTIGVDSYTGVSHLLKVGDRVDLILTKYFPFEVRPVEEIEESAASNEGGEQEDQETMETVYVMKEASVMLMQNVEILALDQAMISAPQNEEGAFYYGSVTLSLTPEQTLEMAMAMHDVNSNGASLYLTLRGEDDSEELDMEVFEGWQVFSIEEIDEMSQNQTGAPKTPAAAVIEESSEETEEVIEEQVGNEEGEDAEDVTDEENAEEE